MILTPEYRRRLLRLLITVTVTGALRSEMLGYRSFKISYMMCRHVSRLRSPESSCLGNACPIKHSTVQYTPWSSEKQGEVETGAVGRKGIIIVIALSVGTEIEQNLPWSDTGSFTLPCLH
ncbi:hypothetical protein HOY82DRAFT_206200 [Tuber indicum]|nr:hypothetical protein HOY82DRAFT_206200 [Tuber indicum]